MRNIKDIVKYVTIEQLGLVESYYEANLDTSWAELGADSLDQIELVMAFEEYLGAEFDDREIEIIKTPNQAIAFLVGKLGEWV